MNPFRTVHRRKQWTTQTGMHALSMRGRSAIAWGFVSYAFLQVGFSLLVDCWKPDLRDPEYSRKLALLQTQIAQHPDQPLVLALGTSRTAYGLRPATSCRVATEGSEPLVFNFGMIGSGTLFELVHLHRLLAEGICPAKVLIEVHPPLLHVDPDLAVALVPAIERCDARDLAVLRRYTDNPIRLYTMWLRLRLATCHWRRGALLSRAAPRWVTAAPQPDLNGLAQTDGFGWVPLPGEAPSDANRRQRILQTVEAYCPAIRDFAVSDVPNRALREMLGICRRAQIEAALVIMPEESEYRRTFASRTQARAEAYLEALRREYAIPLFDTRDCCVDVEFADAQHLLPDGAARFWALFTDLASPWLTGQRDGPAASVARRSPSASGEAAQ